MENRKDLCLVITTFDNEEEMMLVTNKLLSENVAACIQAANIKSHYIWDNAVCHDSEIRVTIKTIWENVDRIASVIKAMHSYQVPEIIALNIDQSDEQYAKWMENVLRSN